MITVRHWGLTVNPDKSKVVVFRKRGPILESEKWLYNSVPLETVDNFNYLGVVFNYSGSFVLNQSAIAGKGLKALNTPLANIRSFVLKPITTCQLFDSFVGSVLCYGCEVWGFSKNKQIERIHLKVCKSRLNVKNTTCTMSVYGELSRYPLYITRYVRIGARLLTVTILLLISYIVYC